MPMARVLLITVLAGTLATGTSIGSLYFFGDSLTDSGNVYQGTSVLNRYTLGLVPREPSAPYVDGRFTNGPVWAEYLASLLGKPQDGQYAGMSLGWFGETGGPGNNYAIGGARTDYGGALGSFDSVIPTGMRQQVDFYLRRHNGSADPSGTYFFLGGGNDLRDASKISDPEARRRAAIEAGENIAYAVRDLYFAGARSFVLINSPDVGLTPESLNNGLSPAATDASVQFNSWLGRYAAYLRTVPDLSLQYFDLFSFHHELVAKYGADAVKACKGGPPELCNQTLFFDSIHPTSWVHQMFAQRLSDELMRATAQPYMTRSTADPSIRTTENPEPATAIFALFGFAALLLYRRYSR
ncbi:MAG TPA: SGNH/GDSL hydrolase family protein [Bryobacteraceae bacterium]|nr:SGNH/GDSL hydrolase family protein [Bryobacteraceae bacterium]